jgi:hypothetical protein
MAVSTIDALYHSGSEKLTTSATGITVTGNIANASGDFTLDVAGNITLDADGGNVRFKDGGTEYGTINKNGTANLSIYSSASDADILFQGNDGGSVITAMTIDMSAGGNVGIGTSSPNDKVDISGSTGEGYRLTDGTHTGVFRSISGGTILKTTTNHDLILGSNDTERMRIDTSGRVTMPYQPAFSAYGNNQSVLVNTDVDATLPNEEFDAGNNYDTSTSRFTAPVAGRYLFTGTVQYNGIGQSHIVFRVNNSFVNNGWTNFGDTESAVQSRILNLAAGDYVSMRLYSSQAGATNGQRTRMTGCLLG